MPVTPTKPKAPQVNLTDLSEGAPSAMTFPCEVPVSAIGLRVEGLAQAIAQCVASLIPSFDPVKIEMRPSKTGKYLAVAFPVWVQSKAELEALNVALLAHPMVKLVI